MIDRAKQETIDTYNNSAQELAEYFRGIGTRANYIDQVFELAGDPNDARVVEIGCGDGRDAKVLAQRTKYYLGFDISEELIKLAREHVPDANFEVADATEFEFPDGTDIVLAFASLLHLNQGEISDVFKRAYNAMNPNGLFYVSMKHSPEYKSELQEDRFGRRIFYYYPEELLLQLAEPYFDVASSEVELKGNTNWIETTFRKKGLTNG
jgi:trans-aconitate methyltransferase